MKLPQPEKILPQPEQKYLNQNKKITSTRTKIPQPEQKLPQPEQTYLH